jgi:dolichol kinase
MPAFILALLVSYSRLALKVHTFYDILGGFFVGVSVSLFWHYFFKKILCCEGENFLFRKLIHLSALIFVFFYFKIPSFYLFLFSLAITTIFGISEVFRMINYYFPVIQEITLLCKKKDEKGFLIEPFLFGLSISILFLLPKELFLIGSLPLIVGDGFAGVIGYKFGKHKIPWNKQKTLEGSLAFFFVSLISLAIFFNIYISFLISILATIIESALKKGENFLLPMSLIAIAKIFGIF